MIIDRAATLKMLNSELDRLSDDELRKLLTEKLEACTRLEVDFYVKRLQLFLGDDELAVILHTLRGKE